MQHKDLCNITFGDAVSITGVSVDIFHTDIVVGLIYWQEVIHFSEVLTRILLKLALLMRSTDRKFADTYWDDSQII